MNPVDWTIVTGYLAVVFGIGIYCSRNQKTTEDFFLAGKNVPGIGLHPNLEEASVPHTEHIVHELRELLNEVP